MRAILGVCAAALFVAACGGPSEEDRVRETMNTFGQAVAARDYTRLCDELLAAELLAKLSAAGVPCSVALSQGFGTAQDPTLKVLSVSVRSDKLALARARTDASNQAPATVTFRLVKEAGQWRVGSLSGQGSSAPPAPGAAPAPQPPGGATTRQAPGDTAAPAPGGTPAPPAPRGATTPQAQGGTTAPKSPDGPRSPGAPAR